MKKIITSILFVLIAMPVFSAEFKTTYLGVDGDGVKSYAYNLVLDDGPVDGRGYGDLTLDFPNTMHSRSKNISYLSKSISMYINCDKSNERFNQAQMLSTKYLEEPEGYGTVLAIEDAPNSDWIDIKSNSLMIRFRDAVCADQKHIKPHPPLLFKYSL